jgi:hypothetical protein
MEESSLRTLDVQRFLEEIRHNTDKDGASSVENVYVQISPDSDISKAVLSINYEELGISALKLRRVHLGDDGDPTIEFVSGDRRFVKLDVDGFYDYILDISGSFDEIRLSSAEIGTLSLEDLEVSYLYLSGVVHRLLMNYFAFDEDKDFRPERVSIKQICFGGVEIDEFCAFIPPCEVTMFEGDNLLVVNEAVYTHDAKWAKFFRLVAPNAQLALSLDVNTL